MHAGSNPLALPLTTAEDTRPPQPVGTFGAITETSLSFSYRQDEPGIAYYVLVVPSDQQALAAQLPAGGTLKRDAPAALQGSTGRRTRILTP